MIDTPRPPLVLSSLSGESDAGWARAGLPYADAAVLGGIALDERAREAARKLVARDRNEFLPSDPVAFVDAQFGALADTSLEMGINVRTTDPETLAPIAAVCADHDAFLEINAHCRQDELCAIGCGERLLADTDRLCRYVTRATDAEPTVPVGVKVRAEVPDVALPATCRRLERAGASFVHVDAMDTEPIVAEIAEACDLWLIANNGVRDQETVETYLEYGADAVSVGRPSDNPAVLSRVEKALESVGNQIRW